MGDAVGLAWLAEGTRGRDDCISFYATPGGMQHAVLSLLRQPLMDAPSDADLLLPDSYGPELRDHGRRLRLEYLRDLLGLSTGFMRPTAQIPSADLEWAATTANDLGGSPVLLFPQTDWESREWPSCYWVDLAWQLHHQGIPTLVILGHADERYLNTPRSIWGHDLYKVAALMSMARLIVGNDSGPAHLAGTLGARTIAICGGTRGDCVFGHIPQVLTVTTHEAPGCAECHFQAPYRAACDRGCQVLYALKTHVILERVLSEIQAASDNQR